MTAQLRDDPDYGLDRKVPMGRLGKPYHITGAVVFLSSRASAYLNGVELSVDGGILGYR